MYNICYANISLIEFILKKNVLNFHYCELRLLYIIQLYNNTD